MPIKYNPPSREDVKLIRDVRGQLNPGESWLLNRLAQKIVDQFGASSVLCEIGSFCGKSTVSLATALKNVQKGRLYAIDWHQGSPHQKNSNSKNYVSTYDEYLKNIARLSVEPYVQTIKKRSEDAVKDVPSLIHLLWIDGSHEYVDVKKDYENFQGKLIQGGFLLFHDACWTTWTGPLQVIRESVMNNPQYYFHAMMGNIMVFRKEKNKVPQWIRNLILNLCRYVSGENRPIHKKMISSFLFRITSVMTLFFHDWNK